jgi:hypothetical protein
MKLISFVVALVACLFTSTVFAQMAPTKVPVHFKRIFVPEGFDDNDNVQFVGEGLFSSSCYRYSDTVVSVNESDKIIRISTSAYKYGGACLMLTLPFDRVIDVGILKAGIYSIIQNQTGAQVGSIVIHSATRPEADDNLYAPIAQAMYQFKNGAHIVTLTGEFPSSCMKLVKVQTNLLVDAVILQPIAEMGTVDCRDGEFAFETEVDLGAVNPGRYLLHIRTMNGKSINSLVNIPASNKQ